MSLPELRIIVEPNPGALLFHWKYKVQELNGMKVKGGPFWQTCWRPNTYSLIYGSARTEERALEKARKEAAAFCEHRLAVNKRSRLIEDGTTIEKVTCQEEPV